MTLANSRSFIGTSRPPNWQNNTKRLWTTYATWDLLSLPYGTGTRGFCKHSGHNSATELSSLWASSKWHPVMSRPFRNHPEQYRNAPELTQPPRLYSTHGKQGIPPTNGQLGGTTHPIQQHTSMQSTPWPPSCSLSPTTSILDLLWAMLTQCLKDWPASMCLRPNVLELPRHAHQMSRLLQLHPVTPRYV